MMLGQRISHFEVLDKLGEGGMGVVYKARDLDLNRFVALKMLPSGVGADPSRRAEYLAAAKRGPCGADDEEWRSGEPFGPEGNASIFAKADGTISPLHLVESVR